MAMYFISNRSADHHRTSALVDFRYDGQLKETKSATMNIFQKNLFSF